MSFSFHVPMKPYTVIDAINRAALATGSIHNAMASSDADFNGHRNVLSFNTYRKYFVGEYTWAGRNVFCRGTDFARALAVSLEEYDRQGKGATLIVVVETEADAAICRANPRLVEGNEDITKALWYSWQHGYASYYLNDDRHYAIPAELFTSATDWPDYQTKRNALLAQRRGQPAV